MKQDWQASAERVTATFLGQMADRIPVTFIASEDIAARISGLTIREMLASSKKLAEVSIGVCEVLGGDSVSVVVTPYCGPYEGLAFAKANGREDLFVWKDYTTPFIREGELVFTLPKDELRDDWGIVKGNGRLPEQLAGLPVRGVRRGPYGVEALVADAAAARERCGKDVVVDRATLDDVMVFMTRGEDHVDAR